MYGFEATVEDIRPLWQPRHFPKLQTLALRNCCLADEIATALATEQPAVSRLSRVDLSLGTLTDLGAEALYNNPAIAHLDSLDVHHHYLSHDWAAKLQALPLDVNVSVAMGAVDAPDDDEMAPEEYRYVAVSE
jgi:hypothetical protein